MPLRRMVRKLSSSDMVTPIVCAKADVDISIERAAPKRSFFIGLLLHTSGCPASPSVRPDRSRGQASRHPPPTGDRSHVEMEHDQHSMPIMKHIFQIVLYRQPLFKR